MKRLTDKQINFIRENHEEKVSETIYEEIDRNLMYYTDIDDALNRFSNILDVLKGLYTMDNLIDDLYNEFYAEGFEDIAGLVYDELDEEEQQEIDELED